MANLSTTFMGLQLKNPVIAASSGITSNLKNISSLEKHGAAAIVLKSLFEEEIVLEMQKQFSHMGSHGFTYPESLEFYEQSEFHEEETTYKYLDLIHQAKKNTEIPIIASINCITAGQWTYFPKEIEKAGADALELNLFILPTDLRRGAEENEQLYFSIIKEVRKQIKIPVAVKTSFYFSNLTQMLTRISESGINGLVLFNRYYSPDIDIDTLEITNGNILSHPEELSLTLRWVALMADRASCDIAATTGIHGAKELIKVLLAGARAGEIASTLYSNGLDVINKILNDLNQWMEAKSFETIDDFCGNLSQANISNPAAYERVQFMKYFRGYKSAELI